MHATEPVSQPSPRPPEPSPPSLRPAEWRGFQDLMPHRVQDILLVSSLYDSFILAEDGQLNELILGEFLGAEPAAHPRASRACRAAPRRSRSPAASRASISIITSLHLGDMNALALARKVREAGTRHPGGPARLRQPRARRLRRPPRRLATSTRVFLWQGDVRILLAIVKYVEDRLNVAHDRASGRPGRSSWSRTTSASTRRSCRSSTPS